MSPTLISEFFVAEEHFELTILLLPLLECCDSQSVCHYSSLYGAGDWTHGRQACKHLRSIPSSQNGFSGEASLSCLPCCCVGTIFLSHYSSRNHRTVAGHPDLASSHCSISTLRVLATVGCFHFPMSIKLFPALEPEVNLWHSLTFSLTSQSAWNPVHSTSNTLPSPLFLFPSLLLLAKSRPASSLTGITAGLPAGLHVILTPYSVRESGLKEYT